jgi:hypothetical protein
MYSYIQSKGGGFLNRNHPTKESHYLWCSYLINEIWTKWKEQIKINKV